MAIIGSGAVGSSRMLLPYSFLFVSVLFLLSGLSSLIYQVIWTRMLVFVFGSTTLATSTVLAVFMGGLALGSFLAGKIADRTRKPFIWYGMLELLIGVWALAAPFFFAAAVPLYKLFFEPLHANFVAFGSLRFAVACLILLVPTACMGATLPLLSRFVTQSLREVGDRVGSLYAVNTLGAVLGALLAGFMLIPNLGLQMTIMVAASTNLFLFAGVLLLSRIKGFMQPALAEAAAASESAAVVEPSQDTREAGGIRSDLVPVVLISIGISGALSMTYEVGWTRSLLMVIGSTTYAFTVMLATFLIGIFLGSYLCSRFVDRLKLPVVWFGLAEMLLCLAGFLSLFVFNFLPYFNMVVGSVYGRNPEMSMLFRFLGAGLIMIPISLCLGFIFPLAVRVCARDLSRLGSSVGAVYSANTIGAIAGAFLSGFFVIPFLGVELTLIYCSVANLLLGLVLVMLYGRLRPVIKALCAVVFLSVLGWTAMKPHYWDQQIITRAQTVRRQLVSRLLAGPVSIPSFNAWQSAIKSSTRMPFYKEGRAATVAIAENLSGTEHSLYTNGHVDASDTLDMENQAMLAALPLIAHPQARNVCVVGWGSGVTVGYGLRFPVANLICAEIEPVVVETSPSFHAVNFKPEADRRTVLEFSDGRNFLLGTAQKFDAIISEPSNPWQAGVCNLFTREYFKICRDSLKEGGIFTLWCQIKEIPTANLAEVLSALHSVYPSVYILDSGHGNVNALCFSQGQKLSFDKLKLSFQNGQVAACLGRFKLTTPEEFIARLIMAPDGVEKITRGIRPNDDDLNCLEYDVARVYENGISLAVNYNWLQEHGGDIKNSIDWGNMSDTEKAPVFMRIAGAALAGGNVRSALFWCEEAQKVQAGVEAVVLAAQIQITQRNYAQAEKILQQGASLYKDARLTGLSGIIALKKGNYTRARQLLKEALEIKPQSCDFRYYLSLCYSSLDCQELDGPYLSPPDTDPEKVIALCTMPAENDKFLLAKPKTLLLLADAYLILGKYDLAESCSRRLLETAPRNSSAWRLLAEAYAAQKLFERSAYCWNKCLDLDEDKHGN